MGVTGARKLPAAVIPLLREQIHITLASVAGELLQLNGEFAGLQTEEPVYRGNPRLRVTSPLARGADRLVAQAALDLNPSGVLVELCVPTPFAVAEYEIDFTGTGDDMAGDLPLTADEELEEFRSLLAHAQGIVELDGTHAEVAGIHGSAPMAYEAVGRYVVRHSDVILAIWDGSPSNGRGGTAEIVLHAVNIGVPVLWINATHPGAPIWIDDLNALHAALSQPEIQADPWERLRACMRDQLAPPPLPLRHPHGALAKLASSFKPRELHPLSIYYAESLGRKWLIWRAHAWLMKHAGRVRPVWLPPTTPQDAIGTYWLDLYTQANSLAEEYAARYRSSYVWTIALSTFTLMLAALSGSFHPVHGRMQRTIALTSSALELLFLLLILINVMAVIRNEWHEKSIEYRLLAELFRKQQTLSIVDWTLPLKSIRHCTDTERLLWVHWFFGAAERSSPLSRSPRLPNLERKLWIDRLIQEQIVYHETRKAVSHNALELFETIGVISFLLIILGASIKLALELRPANEYALTVVELLTIVLPAISAAFITLRGYAELQLLVEQSRQMASELSLHAQALQRINLSRPLASIELGREALEVATLMLQDLEGWGRLFRGKLMEAG
jgi:hypothetical protein